MNFLQNGYPVIFNVVAAEDIQGRISSALTTVQSVLTGIVVLVGIVVGLWIVIKRMPSADDPQEKNEVYKAVGRVLGLVAISAALVWVVPWVYSLFQ
ncbi:CagC family type IV secretion system protein [Marinilactibacillus psychrotolerans]|uniref:CagC family type IV secretion system protein n=1 Tax=Marinilactibacillus psychrotolerans TaxID=191770 RepID=A0ABW8UGE7_9LACT